MEEDRLLNLGWWSKLEEWIRPSQMQSAIVPPNSVRLRRLNDHVHEVYKPCGNNHDHDSVCEDCKPALRPTVEIVFFHGLQLEVSNQPHVTTWLTRDKSEFWLNWLHDETSDARILTVSYDASVRKTDTEGRMDMFIVAENLLSCLAGKSANVGQDGCPVVLVGHCLGGLIMKEVCDKANSIIGRVRDATHQDVEYIDNFLHSVKGVFYYATPHHGVHLPEYGKTGFTQGLLFQDMAPLNSPTERRNEAFRHLRQKFGWKAAGVGENREVALKTFEGFIIHVPEASTRYDTDAARYYTVDAHHFDVCRPVNKRCGSFLQLHQFVDTIVETDKVQLDSYSDSRVRSEVIVGAQENLRMINEELRVAKRLGIVGMGGIGKTTVMDILHQKIERAFDYTCFVEDVKNLMGKKEGLRSLKDIIAENLLFRGRKVDQPFNWGKLKGKTVLMMLDDVDLKSHIMISTEFDKFSDDSRLIVTSREKKFLQDEDFVLYEMKFLSSHASEQLLSLHAFRKKECPPHFQKYVRKMAQKCGNLPLALRVAGACLFRQDESYWIDTYDAVSRASSLDGNAEDGLWSVLARSYESLAPREREMFLDIATCYYGEQLHTVKVVWKFSSWASPHSGWQHLLNKCLVNESRWGYISMHELLRNWGRKVACPGYPHNISSHSRIFDVDTASKLIEKMEGPMTEKPLVKVMMLNGFDRTSVRGVGRALGDLSNLTVLWLRDLHRDDLPFSPRDSPSELTCLIVEDYITVPVEHICRIQSLRCLILRSIMRDPLKEPLCSVGQLRRLEYLEINCCYNLETFPSEIGELNCLEHLEIRSCTHLKIIPPEIGQLQRLLVLRIANCSSLQALPQSIANLQALEKLELSGCRSLVVALCRLWALPALKSLLIESCEVDGWYELRVLKGGRRWKLNTMTSIPITFPELRSMREVNGMGIRVWDDVRNIWLYHGHMEGLLGSLRKLQPLHIHCLKIEVGNQRLHGLTWEVFQELQKLKIFSELVDFPHILGHLPLLRELRIEHCRRLEAFPETLGLLPALQKLEISSCPCLKALPETVGQLTELRELHIQYCNRFETLPETLGQLRTLEVLTLRWLPSLAHLPGSALQAKALRVLQITACCGLRVFGSTAWNLPHLEILTLDDPNAIRWPYTGTSSWGANIQTARPPQTIYQRIHRWWIGNEVDSGTEFWKTIGSGHFPKLRCLSLSGVDAVMSFGSFRYFQALAQLNIEGCATLVKLPESFSQLPSLKRLQIEECSSLAEMPDCPSLEELDIKICDQLTNLGHPVPRPQPLSYLAIRSSRDSEELLRYVGEYAQVKHLEFYVFLSNELPVSLGYLKTLKHLEIRDCHSIKTLPQCVEKLIVLERLTISSCGSLEELPECLGNLTSLKHVTVEYCDKVANSLGRLHAVEQLELTTRASNDTLGRLLHSMGRLELLKRFILHEHEGEGTILTAIPDSIGQLTGLEYLDIRDCPWLTELPASIGQLLRLQKLVIQWCKKLEGLPPSIRLLTNLDDLEIKDCPKVKELPVWVKGPKKMVIKRCKKLEEWRPSSEHVGRFQELELTYEDLQFPVGGLFLTTMFNHGDMFYLAKARQSLREAATLIEEGRK